MSYNVRIVRTVTELRSLQLQEHVRLVADVETYGTDPKNGKLLGVALAPLEGQFEGGVDACYVVVQEYLHATSTWKLNPNLEDLLLLPDSSAKVEKVVDYAVGTIIKYQGAKPQYVPGLRSTLTFILKSAQLVGHNYVYDKRWIDHFLGISSTWHADTRLMWHMSDRPLHSKPYGLKDAQVDVLGWDARGDEALKYQVKERRGSLDKGDHYLADTYVLGHYAGLDVVSTALLYKACKPHFDAHQQWDMLGDMMRYSWLLSRNTEHGVRVDVSRLERQRDRLQSDLDCARTKLEAWTAPYVKRLEEQWRDDRAAKYASDRHRQAFLASPTKWKRFNPSSDAQKRDLFYGVMSLPVVEHVKPRKDRKTGRKVYSDKAAVTLSALNKAVARAERDDLVPMVEEYERAEHAETMLNSFVLPWLKSVKNGRIHPGFNVCGTVTYRLSGFRPQFLNLPFEERELMSCFSVDDGLGGVHMDLRAGEPTVTCHYSQDPGLLKVFRDGLGDVYLDLALTLFSKDQELKEGYDPLVPVTDAVKDRFKRQRKVAKVVQLAVQYTGTGYTVSKSLGCSLDAAEDLVRSYWKHFKAVQRMNAALINIHDRKGYLTNVAGRTLQVPKRREKDVPNTFFQSGCHDILTMFVLEVYRLCEERGVKVVPVLLDCHDSTSNACPLEQVPQLEQAYVDALASVNCRLGMTVSVSMDFKRFTTLAGLKNDEVGDLEGEEQAA